MNILFVHPKYPETFWSYRHALKFVSKKAGFPPLGLLTVAALLPEKWTKRLVDTNVHRLTDEDIRWADYVFLGAMDIQRSSVNEIITRCKSLGARIVAGGPLFTTHHDEFTEVDHLVLNEAEVTLPLFLEDLNRGSALPVYTSPLWADMQKTPIPLWRLIKLNHYGSMNVQYSRGCPYDCEFCDITVLYGRVPRIKPAMQFISELESLYELGWRGSVFIVDDNFIGNRRILKNEILPAMERWMRARRYPFTLNTEASINLADDDELMQLMVRAGFDAVFVGIESPNEESLNECKKAPNRNRDLAASVRAIQRAGIQVQGGFIVGFDKDPHTIFDRLIEFIQETGIVTAMVGLLNAPRGTRLYQRLLQEGRLLSGMTGDNTDFSINFLPKMNIDVLLNGYKNVMRTIYSPKEYYDRVRRFLKEFKPPQPKIFHPRLGHLKTLVKSSIILGIIGKERVHYWKLFLWSLFIRPRLFPLAITLAIYGFHFRKVFENHLVNLQHVHLP